MKKILAATVLILFIFSLSVQAGQFLSIEAPPTSDKLVIYSSKESSFCFYDGSVGEIIFEISYKGNIYINPNIPINVVAKRLFEMLDDQFYWAKDKCEQENKELKKRLEDLKNEHRYNLRQN